MRHFCEHFKRIKNSKKKIKSLKNFSTTTNSCQRIRSIYRFHLISAVDSVTSTFSRDILKLMLLLNLRMSCSKKKKRLFETGWNDIKFASNCTLPSDCHQIIECKVLQKNVSNNNCNLVVQLLEILHVFNVKQKNKINRKKKLRCGVSIHFKITTPNLQHQRKHHLCIIKSLALQKHVMIIFFFYFVTIFC